MTGAKMTGKAESNVTQRGTYRILCNQSSPGRATSGTDTA